MSTQIPGPGTAPDTARIHNIGYRSYDGPRLGRSYARASLFQQSLRGAYGLGRSAKSKVMPMLMLAAMCVPALIVVAVAITTKAEKLPMEYTAYAVFTQLLISLYIASQAPQSVSRDLRFRTVPLYFSRPIETVDYVAAKIAAMSSALFVLTGGPLVILYLGALLAKMDFADQTKEFGQGLAAAALLSVLLGCIGLALAALTPRRGFGVAAIISTLTISYFAVSAVQSIAEETGSTAVIKWAGLFSPTSLIDGVQTAYLGATSTFPGGAGPGPGVGVVYLLVVAALIAGSYGVMMARYRKAGL
jgi:ABC-2 type transport system permease protein